MTLNSRVLQDVVRIYQVVIRLPVILMLLEEKRPDEEERATLVDETYISPIKVRLCKMNIIRADINIDVGLSRETFEVARACGNNY